MNMLLIIVYLEVEVIESGVHVIYSSSQARETSAPNVQITENTQQVAAFIVSSKCNNYLATH